MKIAARSPEHAVELLDRAFNEGDLDAILSFYEGDTAVIVARPGPLVRGADGLMNFFKEAIRSGLVAKQLKTRVIEADGVALFISRWTLAPKDAGSGAEARTFISTSVFRRQRDGSWKLLIDNPFGPQLLDWD